MIILDSETYICDVELVLTVPSSSGCQMKRNSINTLCPSRKRVFLALSRIESCQDLIYIVLSPT